MNTTNIKLMRIAAVSGAVSVLLGAFGAHTLKEHLPAEALQVFETGVRYQFIHTIALLLCGVLSDRFLTLRAGKFFVAGIVLFSGSLYLLALRSQLGIDSWTWLGPLTPLGGIMFILGWISLFVALKPKPENGKHIL
ncbi:MAG TPA: DUF423 domain-containing protein [Bacteroidia bacterium]|nr:DUF423 domain-containing protein [Bacteroidia bacterium]